MALDVRSGAACNNLGRDVLNASLFATDFVRRSVAKSHEPVDSAASPSVFTVTFDGIIAVDDTNFMTSLPRLCLASI